MSEREAAAEGASYAEAAEAAAPDENAALAEQRVARLIGIALPLVTIAAAAIVGVVIGPATSILVVAAGLLLGVIAILWGSLRILSGDAPLPPDLAELDMAAGGGDRADSLAGRKKMLLRALKDLENERAIGKIEPDDYEQISNVYRNDLKVVLQLIDDAIAPLRPEAERVVHAHLVKAGLVGYAGDRGVTAEDAASEAETPVMPRTVSATAPVAPVAPVALGVPSAETRKECPTCQARNEPDAKFCKECATKLVATAPATHPKTEIAEAEDV